MATKIVTVIGGVIGVLSAISILTGLKDIRSGMSTDDPRKTDKGIESVIIGGVFAAIVAGVVVYVIAQINAIQL